MLFLCYFLPCIKPKKFKILLNDMKVATSTLDWPTHQCGAYIKALDFYFRLANVHSIRSQNVKLRTIFSESRIGVSDVPNIKINPIWGQYRILSEPETLEYLFDWKILLKALKHLESSDNVIMRLWLKENQYNVLVW